LHLQGIDVWEHAYYLNYQNKRAEYVDKWWGIIDWAAVSARYEVHALCSREKNAFKFSLMMHPERWIRIP
jgi:hypothetical protein